MKETETAGGVVLNKKAEVLVVNQRGTSWSLPKGGLEKGESHIQAAKREILEESGISQLEFSRELGHYQRHPMDKDPNKEIKSEIKNIHMFLFKTNQMELKPKDPHNPEARWVPKEKVADLLTHPKDKVFFKSILAKL